MITVNAAYIPDTVISLSLKYGRNDLIILVENGLFSLSLDKSFKTTSDMKDNTKVYKVKSI